MTLANPWKLGLTKVLVIIQYVRFIYTTAFHRWTSLHIQVEGGGFYIEA